MSDIQYQTITSENLIAKKSGPITYTHDFDHKNVLDNEIKQTLGSYYNHIVFDPSSRTIWHEGVPYGTAYQFNDSTGHFNNDVFGDINTHKIGGNNNVMMGSCNQTGYQTQNGLFIGSYNKCDDSSYSYIFTIGNGDGYESRSNLLAIHKAKDSTDRTQTSLTGYLNVEHLESNISDSYVSSLGKSATADIILSALLNPAPYILPSNIKINYTYNNQIIQIGTSPKDIIVGISWSNGGLSDYDYNYIDNYVKLNSTLPDGVNLTHLGKTKGLLDDSNHLCIKYNDETGDFVRKITIPDCKLTWLKSVITTAVPNLPSATVESVDFMITCHTADKNKLSQLTYPTFSGPDAKYYVSNLRFDRAGIYTIENKISKTFKFAEQQDNYFEQLYNKGVLVVSDSLKHKGDITVPVTLGNATINVGVPYVYGIVQHDISGELSEMDFNSIMENKNNYNIYDCIYTSSEQTLYFGTNKFKGKKGNVVFIGFPTFTETSNQQLWYARAKTSQDWSHIPNSNGNFNYCYKYNIQINKNISREYIFYVCKQASGNFDYGTESASGTGLYIKVNFKDTSSI